MKFADLHFFDLLFFCDAIALAPPSESLSFASDVIWYFNDQDQTDYDLLDVKYVIAPADKVMRSFLTPIRKTARYILWRAETTGCGEVANSILPKNADSQATLQNENLQWLWKRAREGEFIRWSYPVADATRAAASGPLLVPPRRGTLSDRRVTADLFELQVELFSQSVVVVKTTYNPKWSAAIDGRHADTFMVSPGYIGLIVPQAFIACESRIAAEP